MKQVIPRFKPDWSEGVCSFSVTAAPSLAWPITGLINALGRICFYGNHFLDTSMRCISCLIKLKMDRKKKKTEAGKETAIM